MPVVTVSVLALLADAQSREGLGTLPSMPSLAPCLSADAVVTALWLPDLALLEDGTDSEHVASTARAVAEAATAAAQSASPAALWIAECRDADALPPALRAVFAARIDVSLPTLYVGGPRRPPTSFCPCTGRADGPIVVSVQGRPAGPV